MKQSTENPTINVNKRNFFPKNERLYLQKDIEKLFTSGQTFISYPLRIVYLPVSKAESGFSILVSVSKKRIKHAVERNRIKRFIREAYRLNKNIPAALCKQKEKHFHVAFLYQCNDMKTYSDIEKAMQKAFKMIQVRCSLDKNAMQ